MANIAIHISVIKVAFSYSMHDGLFLIDESTPDGSISVLNACRKKTPDGDLNTARGSATRPDENEQGKLIVTFGPPGSGGNCKLASQQCCTIFFAATDVKVQSYT